MSHSELESESRDATARTVKRSPARRLPLMPLCVVLAALSVGLAALAASARQQQPAGAPGAAQAPADAPPAPPQPEPAQPEPAQPEPAQPEPAPEPAVNPADVAEADA